MQLKITAPNCYIHFMMLLLDINQNLILHGFIFNIPIAMGVSTYI